MAKSKIKVLYFLNGPRATAEDEAAVEQYSVKHNVCFRNAQMIGEGEAIEPFDLVAGAVPPAYAEAAKEKGVFVEPEGPKTPIESLQPGSPLTPPAGAGEGDDKGKPADDAGKGAGEPENGTGEASAAKDAAKPAEDAKPKTPEVKPEAAKGWKPNA